MPHFQQLKLPVSKAFSKLALNPGFLVFALAFLAKAVLQII